MKVTAR